MKVNLIVEKGEETGELSVEVTHAERRKKRTAGEANQTGGWVRVKDELGRMVDRTYRVL